ncbi:MAG: class I SAM-dependent methyltransferase [Candidatus Promineifilaceae bacterium]|nr:class I SAM-dependent methyltransferase [Candidatus Promineifilaceae bacterium]
MNHDDHVRLLHGGVPPDSAGGVWADFGAGDGAFTLALAEILGAEAEIHAVDREAGRLRRLQEKMHARFPALVDGGKLHLHGVDYTRPLDLPPLDGLVMANALHFQRDKAPVVRRLARYLQPGGRFVIVEYNTDRGNRWVPYPLSYERWERLAESAGLQRVRRIARQPSRFLGEFYAALAFREETFPPAAQQEEV